VTAQSIHIFTHGELGKSFKKELWEFPVSVDIPTPREQRLYWSNEEVTKFDFKSKEDVQKISWEQDKTDVKNLHEKYGFADYKGNNGGAVKLSYMVLQKVIDERALLYSKYNVRCSISWTKPWDVTRWDKEVATSDQCF